jgi:imidazolonepropionase-like amidohydrolase
VFDGRGLVSPPLVTVDDDGTIAGVGEQVPTSAEVDDLGDVTLLPGLVDTHQHLCFDGRGTLEEQIVGVPDEELSERARRNAVTALRAGITTIRDLGDRGFLTLALRGDPELPTILASGPPLTADGGHCWYLGGCCSDTDALVEAVHERKARGCDVVKIMVTGGALTPTFPMWKSQFGTEEVATVVATAHELGLPVAAHCHGVEGTFSAVAAGVDTIEHCTFFTEAGATVPDDTLVDRIAEGDIPVSATLGADPTHEPPPLVAANLAKVIDALGALRRRGGTVVVGTDAGVGPRKPHDVLPRAVDELRLIGFDNTEVLAVLTTVAATVIGLGDRKGRLIAGYDADVLAVGGDPTDDPSRLRDVRAVWRSGRRVV